jgi:hypothetical protein
MTYDTHERCPSCGQDQLPKFTGPEIAVMCQNRWCSHVVERDK